MAQGKSKVSGEHVDREAEQGTLGDEIDVIRPELPKMMVDHPPRKQGDTTRFFAIAKSYETRELKNHEHELFEFPETAVLYVSVSGKFALEKKFVGKLDWWDFPRTIPIRNDNETVSRVPDERVEAFRSRIASYYTHLTPTFEDPDELRQRRLDLRAGLCAQHRDAGGKNDEDALAVDAPRQLLTG